MTTVVRNRLYRPVDDLGVDGDPRAFHRRLPGYAPTPIVRASALADELGLRDVWVKDESQRLGLPAFKMLGASWATYRVLVERLGDVPDWSTIDDLARAIAPLGPLTLVAATDGNHGRALARMAALLRLDAHVLVPDGTDPVRIEAICSEGAAVDVVAGTYDDAVAASASLADDTHLVVSDTSWPGYETVPRWVIDGYSTIFTEVSEQLTAPVDVVVVQMGVGALIAAAVVATASRHARVIAVEPDDAACGLRSAAAGQPVTVPGPHRSVMAGLNCGRPSLVAWPIVATGVELFVSIDDRAALDAVDDLARLGIVAGETGAAGLAGLRALAERLDTRALIDGCAALVICTEGPTGSEPTRTLVSPGGG